MTSPFWKYITSSQLSPGGAARTGVAGKKLLSDLETLCQQNSSLYPYMTDFYQESKPFMRALHNAGKTGVGWQLGGIAAALLWKQGPVEILYGNKNGHNAIDISAIEVVHNPTVWKAYQARRNSFFDILKRKKRWQFPAVPVEQMTNYKICNQQNLLFPVADGQLKEVFLYAGFGSTTLNAIVEGGFRPDLGAYDPPGTILAGKGHGALGRGAYLTDRIDKAATYTPCTACNLTGACASGCVSPPRRLIIARVLLGNSLQVESSDYRHAHHNDMVIASAVNKTINQGTLVSKPKSSKGRYHSIIGLGTKNQGKGAFSALLTTSYFDSNEYLVRNADQIYPEFIVHYTVT